MYKRLQVATFAELVEKYAPKLLSQQHREIVAAFTPCFFGKTNKAQDFVKALARIAWEKYSAHPAFVSAFRSFTNFKKMQLHPTPEFKDILSKLPFNQVYDDLPCEICLVGGEFPVTKEQINSIFFSIVVSCEYQVQS